MLKIYRFLLSGIASGDFQPDTLLPKERDLAQQLGTNRMNVNRAVKALEKYNIVVCKRRVGTKVVTHIDHEKVQELINATNRSIYVLYSMTPHWIHWNELSFAGLEEVLEPEGFSVNYSNIPTGVERVKYKELLDDISKAGASALVIFPDSEDARFLRNNADLLLDFDMPIFMLNRSSRPIPLDMVSYVSMDPFGEGAKVGTILRKNNYRNIVMITQYGSFWGEKRLEGLKLGLKLANETIEQDFESIEATKEDLNRIVEKIRSANNDIVIVPANNEFAGQFIDFAVEHGLKTPEDYKLITFDDNPLYRSYNLTSLGIPMKEVGVVLGKMICDTSWHKEHEGKISIKLNSKLIVRETLKPKIV